MTRLLGKIAAFAIAVGAAALACNNAGFEPVSTLSSVRVLGTRADKPFAKPGDLVTIEALAVDARADRTRAMHVYWLPFACNNPRSDLYYACFAPLAALAGPRGAADGGSPDGGTPALPDLPPDLACLALASRGPNKDITACLKEGSKTTVAIPRDLVSSHPIVDGAPARYGLSISFLVACTGYVRLLPPDPTNVSGQTLPLGCFDDNGNQLGPDDFVFSFTRVYAYDEVANHNPVIDSVKFDGVEVVPTQGVVVPRCPPSSKQTDCEHAVDVHVPDDSWELAATQSDQDVTRHEEIWAAYFQTIGNVKSTGRILFDPVSGRVDGSANRFIAPSTPGEGKLWVVVHDNRDGANWVSFPVYVK